MSLSIIIRVKNEAENLKECLSRVYQCGLRDLEVIVVDSGSSDGSQNVAVEFGAQVVTYDRDVWSWGHALNLGIKFAKHKYILCLSAHCFLTDSSSLKSAIADFEKQANLVVLYGKQHAIPEINLFEETEYLELSKFEGKDYGYEDLVSGRCPFVSNSCAMFSKSKWEQEQFDDSLQSLEDYDWAVKVIEDGIIRYSDCLGIYHSHPIDSQNIYRREFHRELESLKKRKDEKTVLAGMIYFSLIIIPYILLSLRSVGATVASGLYKIQYWKIAYIILKARVHAYWCWAIKKDPKYWEIGGTKAMINSNKLLLKLPKMD